MAGVKILHTADLHIGASRSGLSDNLYITAKTEIKNTFFRILKLCESEAVDFLLIAGDLFDSPFVDSETVSEISHAMAQIPETIIAISPGNHDCACPGSVYLKAEFPKNVVVFTSFTEYFDFPQKKVRLFGAAFTDRFEKIPLLSENVDLSEDMINLCVLHGDIVSTLTESDYNPITLENISASGFDYLALGHIHKRSEIQKCGKTFYSYCGCPDGKGFDEDGSRGAYLGTVEKGICRLNYIELSSRQYIFCETDISDCENSLQVYSKVLSQIKEAQPQTYRNHLYRVKLFGMVSSGFVPNTNQIEALLSEDLVYVSVLDGTEANFDDISKLSSESSLRGIFVRKMLEEIANCSPQEADKYRYSLRIGLRAFERGVKFNDN